MKYKHYEYIGTKIGMPLYYCIEENKFYLHDFKVVKSSWMTAATVLLSSLLYPLFKKWSDQGLHYNETIYIWSSVVIGVGLGLFLIIDSKKGINDRFAQAQSIEPPPVDTIKKIVLHEWMLNLICFAFRVFGLLVLLVYPFMLREHRNFLLLAGYPLFWFLITFAFAGINIRKRIKMLIRIYKIYIKRQVD